MTTSTPSRRRARLLGGAVAGLALVLAAPLAASAHVHVSPTDGAAGTTTRLDFTFSHGCDGAPTTAVVLDLPEGLDAVTPVLDGAWTITRDLGADGIPTIITYTAVAPVEDGVSATVSLDVVFASSVADTEVAFPVLQECAEGQNDWSEVAEEGQDPHELEAPAPVVTVGAPAETGDAHGGDHADASAPGGVSEGAADGADPVARWLGGGALVAAVAALIVVLVRRRA
ncbi:DUF1775 domain-containing protein [Microbacterium saccharophilum]|uniref:DUF1775 domain-containing protein n=1 Tax=Microbacterium saccharophilum TaxID=1213358 RepID=A0A5C8HX09_9MICO|nr:DUF1775 domain-containing protein [Microbacterium saccharophilum]TXK10659.1 DUF1775 domain-containing protein [Microbacterium saccharophilum]GEP48268.1 hypothetical protein MSA03_17760 [Microbacterium saccharophilum]